MMKPTQGKKTTVNVGRLDAKITKENINGKQGDKSREALQSAREREKERERSQQGHFNA